MRVDSIIPSPTMWIQDIAAELRKRGRSYYSLHVGQPGITPPSELIKMFSDIIKERTSDISLYSYTSPRGIPELREAIAEDLKELGRYEPNGLKEIVLTSGGIEGILTSIFALTDQGEPVGIIVPAYFHFYSILKLLGNKIVELNTYPSLSIDQDSLIDLFSKVKVVIIANPDNPTGRTLNKEEAKLLADLARDKKVYLIHDIAYYTLYYEASREWPENYCWEYCVTVGTFSKDPGIPGWRLGFVVAREEIANAVAHAREATSYNAPLPTQILILEYLKGKYRNAFLPKVLEEYKARRDALAKALEENLPDVSFKKPGAGIFIYGDFSKYLKSNAEDFVKKIALEEGVLTIPGNLFGNGGNKWIRLSFAWETADKLKEAVEIMASRF